MRLIFFHVRSLLIPRAYVSIESIDCILLLSFEFRVILLISSVKTLCFSFLILTYFYELFLSCLRQSRSISSLSKEFITFAIQDVFKQLL